MTITSECPVWFWASRIRILLSSSKKKALIPTVLLLLYDFCNLKKKFFLSSYWRSLTKIAESRARSGSWSASKRHGFPDPDLYQNVTGPQQRMWDIFSCVGEGGLRRPVWGDCADQLGPEAGLPGQGLTPQHDLQSSQVALGHIATSLLVMIPVHRKCFNSRKVLILNFFFGRLGILNVDPDPNPGGNRMLFGIKIRKYVVTL